MITIPDATRVWKGNYESDVYGSFVAAKNISLDKKGYLKLAKKAMALFNENDDSDFANPLAITADANALYVLTSSTFFSIDVGSLVITDFKSNGPNFGFQSDVVFFNGQPHVSGTNNMKSLDVGSGTWTSRITGLSASFPHPSCVHGGRQTYLIADGNVLRQYDTSYVRDTTNELTIPSDYVITRVIYRDSKTYILTRNITGGRAALIVWGGTGVGNNGLYPVPCHWIYSGCQDDSLIAIMLSTGQLWHFNGSGFKELGALPVYYTDYSWGSNASQSNLIGKIASRGMEADGSNILMMVNGELENGQGSSASEYLPTMPSGLWCYNDDSGLYPEAGVNYEKCHILQPIETATNALVFSTPHEALTGDPVLCFSNSGITGTNAHQTYYAIIIGTNAVQLALSVAEAKAGKNITLSGTPTTGDKFAFDSYDSFGSGQVSNSGPVFVMKELIPDLFFGSRVFFGARAIDNNGSSFGVIMSLGMGRNQGYFITPKIASASVDEAFQRLILKYPHLDLASASFIVKFRTNDQLSMPTHTLFGVAVEFASTTSFTVDPKEKDVQTLAIGNEVEFITGAASGYLAHITEIDTTNPASWVFTIDETLPVEVGDTTDFIGMNWKKRSTFDTTTKTNTQNFAEQAIRQVATWVQFKIAMRGPSGMGMEQLMLVSGSNKQATP